MGPLTHSGHLVAVTRRWGILQADSFPAYEAPPGDCDSVSRPLLSPISWLGPFCSTLVEIMTRRGEALRRWKSFECLRPKGRTGKPRFYSTKPWESGLTILGLSQRLMALRSPVRFFLLWPLTNSGPVPGYHLILKTSSGRILACSIGWADAGKTW